MGIKCNYIIEIMKTTAIVIEWSMINIIKAVVWIFRIGSTTPCPK